MFFINNYYFKTASPWESDLIADWEMDINLCTDIMGNIINNGGGCFSGQELVYYDRTYLYRGVDIHSDIYNDRNICKNQAGFIEADTIVQCGQIIDQLRNQAGACIENDNYYSYGYDSQGTEGGDAMHELYNSGVPHLMGRIHLNITDRNDCSKMVEYDGTRYEGVISHGKSMETMVV